MRKFLWVYVIVFVAVFSFLMLRNRAVENESPTMPNETPTESGVETDPEITPDLSDPIMIEEDTETYTISISIPGGLPQNVHDQISSDLERAITQLKESASYMETISDFPNKLWLSTESVKEYSGKNMRSIEIPLSEYSGGAHGNIIYYTYTYTPSGELVTFADVLENDGGKLMKIKELATEQLLDKFYTDIEKNDFNNSPEGIETEKNFMKETVELGVGDVGFDHSTWVIDGEDIILIFPPYSVAPYAYGTQTARIALADL